MRLLFVVAFLQVFSLQNSFALNVDTENENPSVIASKKPSIPAKRFNSKRRALRKAPLKSENFFVFDENQENNISHNQTLAPSTPLKSPPKDGIFSPLTTLAPFTPLRSPARKGIFSPLTIPAPSTPLKSPPKDGIFSPLTTLAPFTPLRSSSKRGILSPLTIPAPFTPLQGPPKEGIFSPLTTLAPSTPLRSSSKKGMFSPLTIPAPSTPLQSPTEENILSPSTKLKDQLSPICKALAEAMTEGPVSREDMKEIYRKYGIQFLSGLWVDIDLIDLEKSIKLMRRGRNPVTRDGKKLVAHHVTLTPIHLALFPEDIHQGKDRYIVTKKDLLSGKATAVATRLTKQRANEIIKESEAQALENGENVEFHRKGNVLHAAKGPSQIDRAKFNVEREGIFKDLSEKLTLLQLGSS